MPFPPRPSALAAALACAAAVLAAGAGAQGRGEPGLPELALGWTLGDWRAPLVCEIEGSAHRALRRVRITPGPRGAHRSMTRVAFFDLEAPPGTRCHDELGHDEPNVVGQLALTLEAHHRPDTAQHDFQEALRREGGFTFSIVSGRLHLGAADARPEAMPQVDFKGGTAEVRTVRRGTDTWRRLADFPAQRKVVMTLVAPEGTRLELDLIDLGPH